jgi:PAS domain S-box-containing protein
MITRAGGRDNPIVLVNRAFEKITGYRAEDVIGRDARFLHARAPDQPELAAVRRALTRGSSVSVVLENFRRDGSMFLNELQIDPVKDESGEITHFIGVINDVTEQRESAARMQQMQKLKAIGHLTGGIAHDFNNLLTVIIGNLRLLEGTAGDDTQARRVRLALSAAQRGTDLTQRLSAYSRTQRLKEERLPVNDLVTEIEPLLHRTLGEHIVVATALATPLWDVNVDRSQLENALLNLVINARDAMSDGGEITITTENVTIAGTCPEPDLLPGDYVLLTVSDTGTGMSREVRERAFEPFFTTKEVGRGTGLGLSSVYGFVKQSGGHVSIYSEIGLGTAIKIYLPRHRGEADTPQGALAGAPAAARGYGELILLVEDDAEVRGTASAILHEYAYGVIECVTADEALLVLEHRADIDLVLSDVVMPGQMTGYDLYKEIQSRRPGLPVLLTSGYPRDAIPRRVKQDPNLTVLPKPFDADQLLQAIRAKLAQNPPRVHPPAREGALV